MFTWDETLFPLRPLEDYPAIANFAAELKLLAGNVIDIDASVLNRFPMRCLPLIERDMSRDAGDMFAFLRSAGAVRGHFVRHPASENTDRGTCRVCKLGSIEAAALEEQSLLGFDWLFVDDRFTTVIAPWYSDLTFWCMQPGAFDQYLAAHPTSFALYGEDRAAPATRFRDALGRCLVRLVDWSPEYVAIADSLRWQLVSLADVGSSDPEATSGRRRRQP